MIQIENINVSYKETLALDNITWTKWCWQINSN